MPEENTHAIPVYGNKPERSSFTAGREEAWGITLQKVGKTLIKNGFAVSIAETIADAGALVMENILPECAPKIVSFGGSMTVREAGLLESLKSRPELEVLDTFDTSIGRPAMVELRRQALLSDLFICSANALTREGELLLVDGIGNRTAAVQFGPKNVVLLVGRNKLCANREEAVQRLKTLASPANAMRLKRNTPCATLGYCTDCASPERICTYWTIIQRSAPAGRIHIVLINEEAGF